MSDYKVYQGEYIEVRELPVGCVITDTQNDNTVIVGSLDDINLVIDSLERLKEAWY